MKIEVAHLDDLPQLKILYEMLLSAMAELQQEYFQTATQDEDFIKSIMI